MQSISPWEHTKLIKADGPSNASAEGGSKKWKRKKELPVSQTERRRNKWFFSGVYVDCEELADPRFFTISSKFSLSGRAAFFICAL